MWPDCSSPSRLPAPRMSRSCEASWKPAPSVSSDCSTLSRRSACAVILRSAGSVNSAIGAQLGAPDPAAQLIELRQAETVGAVHDQRVGGRNVEPEFDDRGRKQHVVLAVVERRHDVFEHGRRHLPVRDRDLHFRHLLVEEILDAGEVLDARTDVERLAAAIAFAQQRLAHHQRIERRDEGAHREAIDRRRRDDREVAHAGERELQRARDRRRGQREHMHLGAQLLELLLVRDAEMLLLVDDRGAPRSLNLMLLPSSAWVPTTMSTLPSAMPFLRLAELGAGDQARGLRDLDREAAEALGEGLGVLAREQRGRHHDGHLPAAHGGDERRAQRHLGLAEADVAADEPVHRPARAQIAQHRVDRRPAGRRSPRTGSRRRTRRNGPGSGTSFGASRNCRSAAILISSLAISRMRWRIRALRACQPPPPSLSRSTLLSSEP